MHKEGISPCLDTKIYSIGGEFDSSQHDTALHAKVHYKCSLVSNKDGIDWMEFSLGGVLKFDVQLKSPPQFLAGFIAFCATLLWKNW